MAPAYKKRKLGRHTYKSAVPASLTAHGSKAELKSVDIPPTNTNMSTTAQFILLNPTQEGSSFYNRIGRKISIKSLMLQGFITPTNSNASAQTSDYYRVMIVYDRQPNGAFPTLADVLTSYDNAGNTTSTCLDQVNMNNRDRFKVIMDERLVTPEVGVNGAASANLDGVCELNGTGQQQTFNIKKYFKLNRLVSQYKASSNPGVIGDIATGSLFLMLVGQIASAANATWKFSWESRLRFWDN